MPPDTNPSSVRELEAPRPDRAPGPRSYERPALKPLHRKRWRALQAAAVAVDLMALGGALTGAAALWLRDVPSARPYAIWIPLWLVMWWGGFLLAGMYDRRRTENPAEELRRLVHGVTLGGALAVVASFSVRLPLSRGWLLLAWAFALIAVAAARRLLRKTIHHLRRGGRLRRRALIIGADVSANVLADAVAAAPWEGLDVVGFVSVNGQPPVPGPVAAGLVGPASRLRELTTALRITDVLVAPSVAGNGHLGEVVSALDGVPVDLRIAPGVEGFLASRLTVHPLGDRPLVAIERAELQRGARIIKRVLDLTLGAILLLLAAPIIALCALAIRLESPGRAFFRQPRVGLRGREFTILKLRTMRADAERLRPRLEGNNDADGLLFKMRDDPRVTRVGRFLRRASLDELPQLLNVLAGHMSLVGPRPPLPSEVFHYNDQIGRRLLVKPGMTGLWQVSGRNDLSFDDYVRFDLLYVQSWSIALDLYILLRTIPTVLSRRGAR